MPNHDWQQYREQGLTPVALGLVGKEPFSGMLAELGYHTAAQALVSTDELRVVVLHAASAQVMDIQFS